MVSAYKKTKIAVKNLRDIIATYSFDKIMPELANWGPSFKHYKEFEQVMSSLIKLFGDCPGCLQGGGDPNCKVRSCAKQKGHRTCAECAENEPCKPLAPYREGYKGLAPALQDIKHKSLKKYAEEVQIKIAKGHSYLEEKGR